MDVNNEEIMKLYQSANCIRKDVLKMLKSAGSGHLGGSFSIAEILSTLYNNQLKIDSKNPNWDKRDITILSKGHSCPALYSILSQKGFFSKTEFEKLRKINGLLQGHPERSIPGIEYIAGFLGQGLSAGCGMALGLKKQEKSNRVFVIIGDGDNLEGQTWEAARFAVHNKLDNLIAIFDYNNLLSDNSSEDILSIKEPEKQWASFGWNVIMIDGHNIPQIINAINTAKKNLGSPTIIIGHTKKGKGVTLWEDSPKSHGSWGPTTEEYTNAMKELEIQEKNISKYKFLKDSSVKIFHPEIELTKDLENISGKKKRKLFRDYEFKKGDKISLRNAFGMATSNLAKKYENFDVFDADVKGGTMSSIFEENFPKRFIQCGIAEQNMISVAAGYQILTKRIPIVTTYAVFTSLLCAAQFRNGVAMQNIPFIIASSHIGLDTGPDGPTHQAIEDLGIFTTYPNVQVLSPSDANRMQEVIESAILSKKPTYIRTGRSEVPTIYPAGKTYKIGKDTVLIEGEDVTIFATGIMVHRSIMAEKILKKKGIRVEVIDITSIKPLDQETIINSVKKTKCAIIAEDHYVQNGLSTAISQLVSKEFPVLLDYVAIRTYAESGLPDDLAKKYKINTDEIVKKVENILKCK